MSNILRVIEPFFITEVGDMFTRSENGETYIFTRNEEFHKAGDDRNINSSYSATFSISAEYAKELVEEKYLEEVVEKQQSFVNVFDEIDNLISKYEDELDNIDEDFANQPQCLKVEKTTVLTNILSVLNHLKSLKK